MGLSRRISLVRFLWAQNSPLKFFSKLALDSSDVNYVQIGARSIVLLKNPDLVQQLLVKDAVATRKGRTKERALFFRFLGDGLLNSEDPAHRRQRRLILPAFHRSRLTGYGDAVVNTAIAHSSVWRNGEVRDLGADMSALTLAVVANTLFSADVKDTAEGIATAFNQLTSNINRMMFPGATWLLKLPVPFAKRIQYAQDTLNAMVNALIQKRRSEGKDTGDLLSMLLLAEDAERPGEHLSDNEVRDQAMTLFFAGHETTSNALTWVFWLLSQHSDIEDKLHAELAQVLNGRVPSYDDFPRLVVTEQIVREVMRLYPPVWTIGRQTTEQLTFGDYQTPKGSLIIASQWIIHRDPRWFAQPLAFRPERWTPEFRASIPRFAYFPFGGGSRSCIGENFAWMELVLIVATIAQRWRFTLTHDAHCVTPQGRITLHPDRSVRLRLHKRG